MDQKTLAYINMYAVLGALRQLCQLSERAREILGRGRMDLAISVRGGPEAMLRFEDGSMRIVDGTQSAEILLKFSSPEKFNGMIDGTVTPFPSKGLLKVGFLLKKFTRLTDLLAKYLAPHGGRSEGRGILPYQHHSYVPRNRGGGGPGGQPRQAGYVLRRMDGGRQRASGYFGWAGGLRESEGPPSDCRA